MGNSNGGKREEIRGTTSRDILNINNNFKWLWNYVFGNINFTDINASVINKLGVLQNSINGVTNTINQHKDDNTIHTNTSEKSYWNNHIIDSTSHVTSTDKSNWNSHKDNSSIHVTQSDKDSWNYHKNDNTIHVTSTDKNNWNSKANGTHTHTYVDIITPNSTLTNATNIIGTIECIKIANIVNLVGTLKNNTGGALSNEVTIATVPVGYRPTITINLNVRTSLGLAKLNIYSTGEVKIDLTTTTGYITSLANLSDVFLNGITFKGA